MTVPQPQLSQLTALTPPKSSRHRRPPFRGSTTKTPSRAPYSRSAVPTTHRPPEPRTAGPLREQPARRAAFPPPHRSRALPAASDGRTCSPVPGTRPRGRTGSGTHGQREPRGGRCADRRGVPFSRATAALRLVSPQQRRAAVPQHPAPGRQRLLPALPPSGGGGGPRSHPIPGRKRRTRVAEGAGRGGEAAPGRAGVLHGRVLWPDASGLGFCVPVPKPGEVCGQPPWAVGGVFPRGRRRRPTAPSESSRREAGAVAHRDDCRACMNCGGVGVQHALWNIQRRLFVPVVAIWPSLGLPWYDLDGGKLGVSHHTEQNYLQFYY